MRRAFSGVALGTVAYTLNVEYRKRRHHSTVLAEIENLKSVNDGAIMRVGSVEDIFLDRINTGDIVVFNRRWYNYHLPTAFMIKLYQVLTGSEFDHSGIVINDEDGVPYLLENTPFGGLRYRSLGERIQYSQAQQIIVIPLEPSIELTRQRHLSIKSFLNAQLQENSIRTELCDSFLAQLYNLSNSIPLWQGALSSIRQNRFTACANSALVLAALDAMDIHVTKLANTSSDSSRRNKSMFNTTCPHCSYDMKTCAAEITIQDFIDRSIHLSFCQQMGQIKAPYSPPQPPQKTVDQTFWSMLFPQNSVSTSPKANPSPVSSPPQPSIQLSSSNVMIRTK